MLYSVRSVIHIGKYPAQGIYSSAEAIYRVLRAKYDRAANEKHMHFRNILRMLRLSQGMKRRKAIPGGKRTILLISELSSECNSVRVFSLTEGWHLIFAPNVSAAVGHSNIKNVTVVLYDEDVPGMKWQEGVQALLNTKRPAFLILLSPGMYEDRRAELWGTEVRSCVGRIRR